MNKQLNYTHKHADSKVSSTMQQLFTNTMSTFCKTHNINLSFKHLYKHVETSIRPEQLIVIIVLESQMQCQHSTKQSVFVVEKITM